MNQATQAQETTREQLRDGSHDFDFLRGCYRVHNVRLADWLDQASRWQTFEAISIATPLPRGSGWIDELLADNRADYAGSTLRLYDPRTRCWSLYRSGSESDMRQQPLQGSFRDGVGIFEGCDEVERQSLRVRIVWSQVTAASARCEQAFSRDRGATWQPNWIMQYTRLGDPVRSLHAPLAR